MGIHQRSSHNRDLGSQHQNQWGFRVISVSADSPAQALGLTPLVDFIITLDNDIVTNDRPLGTQLNEKTKADLINLGIYSAIYHKIRVVKLKRDTRLNRFTLGAEVRYEPFSSTFKSEGLKVVQVFPESAAEAAGLQGGTDWIMSTVEGDMFRSPGDLFEYLQSSSLQGLPTGVLVYSSRTLQTRHACVAPELDEDGTYRLGAEVSWLRPY